MGVCEYANGVLVCKCMLPLLDIIPIASYVIVFEKKHAHGTSRFKTQHNFPSSSMDLQNKLEAQIRSLKEGDEGFYAIITWYVVEKWGESLYGS